ncbi:TPA: hypothetical protein ACP31N_001053 [Pseudomonas aeruginosa]
MSEVKRFDVPSMRSLIQGEQAVMGYEVVLASDYDALAAEAQALREEIKKAQNALAFTEQWYGVRHERLWHWAHAELNEEQKRRYFNIVANGTAEHSEPPTFAQQLCRTKHRYECAEQEVAALRTKLAMAEDAAAKGDAARQQCGGMEMEIEELRAEAKALRDERDSQQRVAIKAMEELAALRARVVVTPDASTVYAVLDARERLFTSPENIQVALEAQSRLNGMTVSEELLRRVTADPDYEEVFTMDRGEALTELLDLLNQDKENGDHAA